MTDSPLHQRTEAILRRLVRRESGPALRKVLARFQPADLAAAMQHLTWSEQRRLYGAIDDLEQKAEILAMLPEEDQRGILRDLTQEAVVEILENLDDDDATDVVAILPDEMRQAVLAGMDPEEGSAVRQLLAWPSDSAGGIMSTDVFVMPEAATCGAAVRALQKGGDDVVNAHYVYVVDADRRLVGVASLRQLVVRPAGTPLSVVMTRDPITVRPADDQEDVARFVARYDLLAIPVVDEDHRLLGIVTVDDVVDVIREEAAEDMFRMAGLSEDADGLPRSVIVATRQRAGWLLATLFGGIFAAEIIGSYEATLAKVAVLAGFIPVIMGMGGNVGIQSATVAVRGLATGHVQLGGALTFVLREARVGLLLAAADGTIIGVYGMIREIDRPMVGVSVGVSVGGAIALASLLGAGIPVGLSRFKVDPAVATGPLVTTLIDVLAIILYFNIARALLGL